MQITIFDEPVLRRSMKNFNVENFLSDLQKQLKTLTETNLNTNVSSDSANLTKLFQNILNKHSTLRQTSRREKRFSRKPWISNDTLQLMKTKNRLFRTHYRSNNPIKKQIYKKHLNKLTHVKYLAKRQYYENVIKNNQGNSRQTWSVIGKIIDYKNATNQSKMMPATMEINNHVYDTNSETFLNNVCNYFANVGSLMAKNLPNQHNSYLKIYSKRSCRSFSFHEITENEVNECINNIKN